VPDQCEAALPESSAPIFGRQLAIGVLEAPMVGGRLRPFGCFNGKIARPRLSAGSDIRAAFDFALEPGSRNLIDHERGLVAKVFNRPTRAMTGPSFGAPGVAPALPTHDAVHFHDDDVSDVDWPETFRFVVPDDLPSGVYAMRLRCSGGRGSSAICRRPAAG